MNDDILRAGPHEAPIKVSSGKEFLVPDRVYLTGASCVIKMPDREQYRSGSCLERFFGVQIWVSRGKKNMYEMYYRIFRHLFSIQ